MADILHYAKRDEDGLPSSYCGIRNDSEPAVEDLHKVTCPKCLDKVALDLLLDGYGYDANAGSDDNLWSSIRACVTPEQWMLILEARLYQEQRQAHAELLKKAIVALVLQRGETYSDGDYQAVFTPGRESVDITMLKGYSAAHPEVLGFIKIGKPSVSVRKAQKKA